MIERCRQPDPEEVSRVPKKSLEVHLPWRYEQERLIERLEEIAKNEDRSVNELAVQALLEFLDRKEAS